MDRRRQEAVPKIAGGRRARPHRQWALHMLIPGDSHNNTKHTQASIQMQQASRGPIQQRPSMGGLHPFSNLLSCLGC